MLEEIVPAMDMPELGLEQYAEEVFERFLNPYIDHKLQDIALNTVGKIKVRVLPTLLAYEQNQGSWPERLVQGLAGFLYLYRPIPTEDGYKAQLLNGEMISLRDDPDVLKALAAHWDGYDSLSGTAAVELENRVANVLSDAGIWGENLNEKEGLRAALVHEIGKLEGEAK